MGVDLLHRGGRDHDAADRVSGRPLWRQAAVSRLRRGLHRRLHALRHGAVAGRDRAVPDPAGHVRRRARPAIAIGAARDLSPGAPGFRDGPVWRWRDGRACARSGARRLAHRKLQLALRVLHQSAGRRARLPRYAGVSAGVRTQERREARLVRLRHVEPCDWGPSGPARPRRAARLVRLRRDLDRGDHRGLGILPVPGPHLYGRRAVRSPGAVPGSQFRGRHAVHRDHWPHVLRLDGVAAALSARSHELSGGHCRPGDGAARHRHHGGHDACRPAGGEARYAPPARRSASGSRPGRSTR